MKPDRPAKRRRASTAAIFLIAAIAHAIPSRAQESAAVDIAYVEPADPRFLPILKDLRDRRVLEDLRAFLSPLRLPRRLRIAVEQCDAPIRLYKPGGGVAICYEYVARLVQLAIGIPREARTPRGVSRGDAIAGAFIQTALQQTASAIFDILDLPVWGREQDAADKLAAFLMLQFGPETARSVLNGAAHFFEASDRTWTGSDFADVRGTEAQRFYNHLCIAFGSNRKLFGHFVEGVGRPGTERRVDLLPQSRAARCAGEYDDLRWAFVTLILPHADPALMQEVRKIDWLRNVRPR